LYLRFLINKINSYMRYFFVYIFKKNIIFKGKINILGKPIIDIRKGSELIIEDNVTLNSQNFGYHINMQAPVKIFCDLPGAQIYIGKNTRIHGSCIHAQLSVKIGKNCLIAGNTQIFDNNGHDLLLENPQKRLNSKAISKPVVVNDNVWIGANSIILPGVSIGEGSVIAAGSVVVNNVPSFCLVGGNPAKIIRKIN
jgi:acetyltransferase-like isoleucine patch superfamily enzyme